MLAILNSGLIGWYHYNTSPKAKKGIFPKILVDDINNLPIPEVSLLDQQPFIDLSDLILFTKQQNPQADTTALEQQIDQMVYELYSLTEEEIKMVEAG